MFALRTSLRYQLTIRLTEVVTEDAARPTGPGCLEYASTDSSLRATAHDPRSRAASLRSLSAPREQLARKALQGLLASQGARVRGTICSSRTALRATPGCPQHCPLLTYRYATRGQAPKGALVDGTSSGPPGGGPSSLNRTSHLPYPGGAP